MQSYSQEKTLIEKVYLCQLAIAQKIQSCYGFNTEFFTEFKQHITIYTDEKSKQTMHAIQANKKLNPLNKTNTFQSAAHAVMLIILVPSVLGTHGH